MADEPSWDELFASQPAAAATRADAARGASAPRSADVPRGADAPRVSSSANEPAAATGAGAAPGGTAQQLLAAPADPPQSSTRRRGPRRRRSLSWLWVLLGFIVVVGVGAGAVYLAFEPQIKAILTPAEPTDYEGEGTGEVVVTITDGQVGGDVAQTLVDAGVTRSYGAFYSLLLADPTISFQPGSYSLRSEMSASSALALLRDPASKVLTQVVIPEGTTLPGVLARLAEVSTATGVDRAALDAASADLASFGLPPGELSLEGWLFPATYSFDPGLTAHDMLQRMVDEMISRLDALGVAPDDRHRVLTLAALTQKEGGSADDFFKVARVWENRLAIDMHLQSDASVSYGVGGTTIETTEAERLDASNPYNTYANAGPPAGPISNPGEAAIAATISPAEGNWLYFVLVNGETGETVFSDTYDQHLVAVEQWGDWLRAHPDFEG